MCRKSQWVSNLWQWGANFHSLPCKPSKLLENFDYHHVIFLGYKNPLMKIPHFVLSVACAGMKEWPSAPQLQKRTDQPPLKPQQLCPLEAPLHCTIAVISPWCPGFPCLSVYSQHSDPFKTQVRPQSSHSIKTCWMHSG